MRSSLEMHTEIAKLMLAILSVERQLLVDTHQSDDAASQAEAPQKLAMEDHSDLCRCTYCTDVQGTVGGKRRLGKACGISMPSPTPQARPQSDTNTSGKSSAADQATTNNDGLYTFAKMIDERPDDLTNQQQIPNALHSACGLQSIDHLEPWEQFTATSRFIIDLLCKSHSPVTSPSTSTVDKNDSKAAASEPSASIPTAAGVPGGTKLFTRAAASSPTASGAFHHASSELRPLTETPISSLIGISVLVVDHLHASVAALAALKWALDPAKPKKESLACAKALLELLHGLLIPHLQNLALNLNGIFQLGFPHILCVANSRLLRDPQVQELLLAMLDRRAIDVALQQLDYISHNRAAVDQFVVSLDRAVKQGTQTAVSPCKLLSLQAVQLHLAVNCMQADFPTV